MGSASTLAMFFQSADASTPDKWLVVFVGIIAFCSFVQFLVLVGAAIGAFKAYKSVSAEIGMLKQKALPVMASVQGVVDDARPVVAKITAKVQEIVEDATPKVKVVTAKVQEIIEDATPKVKTVTTNVVDISNMAKSKVQEFEATLDKANETIREANDKTRAQVDRVDGMVSSALKATSDVGNTIHRGIRMPVMEVAGVVNGVKAAIDVLVGRAKHQPGMKGSGAGYAGGRTGQSRYGSGPGPVPVASSPIAQNPSSNVVPSPSAAALEKWSVEQLKK